LPDLTIPGIFSELLIERRRFKPFSVRLLNAVLHFIILNKLLDKLHVAQRGLTAAH